MNATWKNFTFPFKFDEREFATAVTSKDKRIPKTSLWVGCDMLHLLSDKIAKGCL